MRILLTGAAGFVGRHLLSQLTIQGHFVRALTRPAARVRTSALEQADESILQALAPNSDFGAYLANIDTVVHLADGFNAYEHLPHTAKNEEAAERLQTTIALADAAARSNVRFIYLSTIKTMCGPHANEVLSEKTMAHPQSLYGQLKLEAENAILEAAQRHGSKAVMLRFPIVFGSGVGGNMEKLLALADTVLPMPFKGLESRRSLISIHSLIDAVMVIVEQESRGDGIFLVHDGAVSGERLVSLLRRGLGRSERLFAVSPSLWKAMGSVPGFGTKLQRFTHPLELDDQKFRNTYDWQPEKTLSLSLTEYAGNSSSKL